jgi:hypothetical protein
MCPGSADLDHDTGAAGHLFTSLGVSRGDLGLLAVVAQRA